VTPEQRTLRSQLAAHTLHAFCEDPAAHTAPARSAFDARFYREVDPDNQLPEAERERRAAHARSAYFKGLALKSSLARSTRP
jgi:hypothetical protein